MKKSLYVALDDEEIIELMRIQQSGGDLFRPG
jgi:hypothetical protein